jgi:outer membrane protein TolC
MRGLADGVSITEEECVQLALARSPSAQAAVADVAAADARVRAARAAYWPRLFGQAQYGKSQGYDVAVTNGGVTTLALAVDAPLLDGGLRDGELAAARARLRSASALAEQQRADIANTVRVAYATALAARAEADVQAGTVRSLTDYAALLQRQTGLGLVPASDPPRAELAIATARTAERAARSMLDVTARELTELTGTTIDASELAEPANAAFVPPSDGAIDSSPLIVDARAAADAAARESDVVRSDGRSRLVLTGDGGFLGVDPGNTFRNNGGGEFLLGFTVPLFDGGAIAARVAAAQAAAASATAQVGRVREHLAIELARTRADAERAQTDEETWRRALPAAAEAFLLMRARYFGGAGVRLLDVLDALTQSVDAHLAIPRATLAYRLAIAAQAQLLGQVEP